MTGVNSTSVGDGFRDSVAALLRTKYEKVDVERIVAGKAVDIYVEYIDYGSVTRIGFECKKTTRNLTSDYIRKEIISHYAKIISDGHLNFVVIVGNKQVAASVRATIEGANGFRFRTIEELQEDIIGIRPYIISLTNIFGQDRYGLANHYVDARFKGVSETAEEYLDRWISNDHEQNIAILGGYGTGKTSFAKYYASHRAKLFLNDARERMPLLISIGSEIYETKLESIFGKLFSTNSQGTNFRFDAMIRLNEEGRLILLFDGFDEMKHAMTSSDFHANFSEINRLLKGKSKIILLGRPNALTSDDRRLVFRGLNKIGDSTIQDPNWPVWREVEIDQLSEVGITEVLTKVLKQNSPNKPEQEIHDRVLEIIRSVNHDLLARPIQTRLIATIAGNKNVYLPGLKEYHIYFYFIEELLKRDAERRSRRNVSIDDRREFQERLAFWAWRQRDRFFYREAIPDEIFKGLVVEHAVDRIARNNEFIVSTLTDEKELGIMRFAHRSIHEFLVSRYLLTITDKKEDDRIQNFLTNFDILSPEILLFLGKSDDIGFFRKLWLAVAAYRDNLSVHNEGIRDFLKSTPFFTKHFVERICESDEFYSNRIDPRYTLDILVHIMSDSNEPKIVELLKREAIRVLMDFGDATSFSTALILLVQIERSQQTFSELVVSIAVRVARNKRRRIDQKADAETIHVEKEVSRRLDVSGTIVSIADLRGLVATLYAPVVEVGSSRAQRIMSDTFQQALLGDIPSKISVDMSTYRFPRSLRLPEDLDLFSELKYL